MTASPMNFSTVPPCRSSTADIRSKKRDMTRRSVSGIEPLAERRRIRDIREEDGDRAATYDHVLSVGLEVRSA